MLDLKKHESVLHIVKDFQCQICDKVFGQHGNLKRHETAVHEGKKDFKCEICDKYSNILEINGS